MREARIKAVITADDRASATLKGFGTSLSSAGTSGSSAAQSLSMAWLKFTAVAAVVGVAIKKIIDGLGATVDSANRYQAAMVGLNSISRAFGANAEEATKAAKELTRDGLMPVAEAATGLKNLLAAGFTLPQSIKLMERFKDSAAFARQGSLSFGEAVRSATEGIKNGNSILVDNAGVTKNLSVILTEAGYSAQDMQRASTDAGVRMALFNGILKETNAQVGDAARLTELFAGKQAQIGKAFEDIKVKVGVEVQNVLLNFFALIEAAWAKVNNFFNNNPLGQQVMAAMIIMVNQIRVVWNQTITELKLLFRDYRAEIMFVAKIVGGTLLASFLAFLYGIRLVLTAVREVVHFFRELKVAIGAVAQIAKNPVGEIGKFVGSLKGRQSGGPVTGGTPYIVGEAGPEVFVPNNSGKIIPNNKIGAMGGSSSNTTININVGLMTGSAIERRDAAEKMFEDLKAIASMRGQTVGAMINGA